MPRYDYTQPASPIEASTVHCIQLEYKNRKFTITPQCIKHIKTITKNPELYQNRHTAEEKSIDLNALRWLQKFAEFLDGTPTKLGNLTLTSEYSNTLAWVLELWATEPPLPKTPPF
jgi:hypothetical protein